MYTQYSLFKRMQTIVLLVMFIHLSLHEYTHINRKKQDSLFVKNFTLFNLLGTMRHYSFFRGCHLSERRATKVIHRSMCRTLLQNILIIKINR